MNATTNPFILFVQMPAGFRHIPAIIGACRAGGVGVINAELEADSNAIARDIEHVAANVRTPFGLHIDRLDSTLIETIRHNADKGLGWLFVDSQTLVDHLPALDEMRALGINVLLQVTGPGLPLNDANEHLDGVVLKGHEAGGFVGENSTFVLLQKWYRATDLPLYVHGGLTPHVAAACHACGAAGGVFDSQVLLLEDLHPPKAQQALFEKLAGSETVAVGDGEHGEYFRILVRPGHNVARALVNDADGHRFDQLRVDVAGKVNWTQLRAGLLPIGQDIGFAGVWRTQYRTFANLFRAVEAAIEHHLPVAAASKAISPSSPLAQTLGIGLPIVQGPMTRVSDKAEFAQMVAEAGALPMVALALLKGASLEHLLSETTRLLGDKPWGIGLLGFAPQALLDEQLAMALKYSPRHAIIAGGRPDQAVQLEAAGIPSYLHVPASALIPLFLSEGARRFIFEGRECGGHIGPLSSFVLWSAMVDKLLAELDRGTGGVKPEELEVLFAGGIHDATSSALVQVLVAPLVERGVKVGILMGSAYLFTKQIVNSGAIVDHFQQEVIDCDHTVSLTSGPGHASRCAYTPFAEEFFRTRERLQQEGVPADEARKVLDDLIMGRLRIASKGVTRSGPEGKLESLDEARQRADGMYMLGQVATLRASVTDVQTLHEEVSTHALDLLVARREQLEEASDPYANAQPMDVAIVGIGSLLPKADSPSEYWDNILENLDAISEVPRHRWDWRLYFDTDRHAKDKVYSKWGGFLDDLVFDPTQYGMPPRSVASVDPMQLIALEVAERTLQDAGYSDRSYNHERTSIIVGASGGTGDVGTQYGIRSELPRFTGELSEDVAARLPEWTEDSFAGILANVIAGRIANRLNFGGVNFTTDAACASSLAALYQGINELIAGRSDLVLAGGVDTVQGPFGYLCFSKTQALSPRGRCLSFDSTSDGIVISEGVAMIAIKRLADAQRDGDRIYAVIKGAGGSSDGRAKGMTAPLPAGQLRAMRRAYQAAGFGPDTVGLFEAHGTGTVAGDTAELESTTSLVRDVGGHPHGAVVGSVKTMIGHTKATAGMAGLVKAALALHHRVLPPHRGVQTPNSVLMQDGCPLRVIDQPLPWLTLPNERRRSAVSAFGFGGTNFHIVMEEYTEEFRPWMRPTAARRWPAELFLWSAASAQDLVGNLERLQTALTRPTEVALRDIAAGLAESFRRGPETLAIVARTLDDLATKLAAAIALLKGETSKQPAGIFHSSAPEATGKVAVLFSGQGSQYTDMLRELAVHFPICAETLQAADAALEDEFEARFGERLSTFIFPRACYDAEAKQQASAALTSTDVAQPALGAVDAALFHLLTAMGLSTDMLAGHSFGEFVALYAGGAIDFTSMMKLAAERGRAIVDASKAAGAELGTMAAVMATRDQVEAAIAGLEDVVIANHNAPKQTILSGSQAGIDTACHKLSEAGIRVSTFPVAAAFHSPLVAPAKDALAAHIEQTAWQPTSIPVYSNTTAKPHAADVATTKQRMAEHLVKPVEFVAQIEAMHADGARIFVELGPKSVLSRLTSKILGDRPHTALSIDGQPGLEGLLSALAQLITAGLDLDVSMLFERRADPLRDPYKLPAPTVIPKHAWLINGSGSRRAGEPVRQIGLTYEEAQALLQTPSTPHPTTDARPQDVPVATPPVNAVVTQALTVAPVTSSRPAFVQLIHPTTHHRSETPPMSEPNQPAMNGYFAMMQQFLETQERVMAMYMRAPIAPSMRSSAPAERVLQPVASPRRAAAIPAPRPAPAPAPAPVATAPVATAPAAPVAAPAPVATAPAPVATAPAPAPVATAPAPAPVATAPAPAPVASSNGASKTLDRAKMADLLLEIVEEKTGYPRDMVGLDQNLESDLGIDSIKRIEVVSAMLEFLPETQRKALAASRGEINTQATLDGMLNIIGSVNGTSQEMGSAVPFDSTEAGPAPEPNIGLLPRYLMVAQPQPIEAVAARRIRKGHFVLTDDERGIAPRLAERLTAEGCTVHRVESSILGDEDALVGWIRDRSFAPGDLSGIIHLAPLSATAVPNDASVDTWRHAIQRNEKSLFLLVRDLNPALADDGHILAASGLGGTFARQQHLGPDLQLQGGSLGLLKSHSEERPSLRVKAVDLDLSQSLESLTESLADELWLVGGRQEIGYPQAIRTAFHTVDRPAEVDPSRGEDLKHLVVIATGGARGVTSEMLRELAAPTNTLILTGRRPLPDPEAPETAALTTEKDLRNHFIGLVRSGATKLTPGEIGRTVQQLLAAREVLQTIEDFREMGATVEYHSVDVTNEQALQALVADVQARFGPVNGIVHGAGIIEDKLVVDKTSESWSRVVETKVMGLLLLQRTIDPANLKFFTVLSSVAGRYGNSGQADYATANELMNRLCSQLQAKWNGRVNVMALCWGPWGPTTYGSGMVNAETEAKFAEKGVYLVTPPVGRRLFGDELIRTDTTPVEIICGEGPWEAREAALGQVQRDASAKVVFGPLLGEATVEVQPKGDQIVTFRLDSQHAYLNDHRIDDVRVLPAAGAVELFAEAASALWPGWKVVEVKDCRLMKGIDLKTPERTLKIAISPPPYGSSEGFEVNANLQTPGEAGKPPRIHYRCVMRVAQQYGDAFELVRDEHDERQLSTGKAYGEWLFHGSTFQIIEQFEGLAETGATAIARKTTPAQWLPRAQHDEQWVFDPALLDAGPQIAIVFDRAYRDQTVLPARFGRVIRYADALPDRVRMVYEAVPTGDPSKARANVYYLDMNDQVVMMVEDLEGIASAALNRLANKRPAPTGPSLSMSAL